MQHPRRPSIRFVETLAEETRQHHIDVNAIAPGALNTRMLDEFLAAGPAKIGRAFHERAAAAEARRRRAAAQGRRAGRIPRLGR